MDRYPQVTLTLHTLQTRVACINWMARLQLTLIINNWQLHSWLVQLVVQTHIVNSGLSLISWILQQIRITSTVTDRFMPQLSCIACSHFVPINANLILAMEDKVGAQQPL